MLELVKVKQKITDSQLLETWRGSNYVMQSRTHRTYFSLENL